MLLKHRPPAIDDTPARLRAGLDHLDARSVAVLRWLNANKVDFVLVGPVAHAIRGDVAAKGPVAIVAAPYRRNFDRLTRALIAEHAGLRGDRLLGAGSQRAPAVAVKLTPEKLACGRRWMLRFGAYDLDLESAGTRVGRADAHDPALVNEEFDARPGYHEAAVPTPGVPATSGPRYQELLYEASLVAVADGLSVQVASPEDLEHFSHVRRTGVAPEFRITRTAEVESPEA
jgi:hypothetical protein